MRDGNIYYHRFSHLPTSLVFELPMRDGNSFPRRASRAPFYVFELPMRDGNCRPRSSCRLIPRFLNFLWGMETCKALRQPKENAPFLNFLWGMETSQCKCPILFWASVFELPMRDGNRPIEQEVLNKLYCFWTSYEGWKSSSSVCFWVSRIAFLNFLWGMETGLSSQKRLDKKKGFWTSYEGWKLLEDWSLFYAPVLFLNFLWGMETIQDLHFRQLSLCVFELPTRDGNLVFCVA